MFRINWPLNKIFLMCLKSAQVCPESLPEHFIFKIFRPWYDAQREWLTTNMNEDTISPTHTLDVVNQIHNLSVQSIREPYNLITFPYSFSFALGTSIQRMNILAMTFDQRRRQKRIIFTFFLSTCISWHHSSICTLFRSGVIDAYVFSIFRGFLLDIKIII